MYGLVKNRASPAFWRCYHDLPEEVRRLADKCFGLLKDDPSHPSLHFKKAGRYWSARVGLHYRAVAVEEKQDLIWFWIGIHGEYDKLMYNQ